MTPTNKTLDEIFAENPVATLAALNLFYVLINTDTTPEDGAIQWSDFKLQIKDYADTLYATTAQAWVRTAAEELTNKRYKPRRYSVADLTGTPATLALEIDTYDEYEITALAHALKLNNPSTSTPVGGEKQLIAITSDASAHALTYDTIYVAKAGVALPSTTVASKTTTLLFIYNAGLGKYNLMAVGQE